MSMLFGLTDYTEVLGQLGVTTSEFKEDDFISIGVEAELELDLLQWFPDFQSLSDVATPAGDVKKQQLALRIYAKVFCAHMVAVTAPLRFVNQSGDGDNAVKRFQNSSSLNDFIMELEEKKLSLKNLVLSLSTAYSPVEEAVKITAPTMVISSPSVDVITGE